MFGINEARRRKIMAEENAFDYADKATAKPKPQPRVVVRSERTQKFINKGREVGRSVINNIFEYRPNKPSKLKTKAVKGIYKSPFKR